MQLILLITKHSLCVTCGSQWSVKLEEVARPFILAGHTMQPDRFLNRILIGYIFFFWRVNART